MSSVTGKMLNFNLNYTTAWGLWTLRARSLPACITSPLDMCCAKHAEWPGRRVPLPCGRRLQVHHRAGQQVQCRRVRQKGV